MTLDEVLVEVGGKVAERQNLVMANLVNKPWTYETRSQTLTVGKASFHAGILGSYAATDDTWLWAWANEESNLPVPAVEASRRLRDVGRARAIESLTTAMLPMRRAEVARLAIASIGLLGADAYYIGDTAGGLVVLAIEDPRAQALAPPTADCIVQTFTALITAHGIADHRRAFRAYLEARGIAATEEATWIRGAIGRDEIVAEFDALDRLRKASYIAGAK